MASAFLYTMGVSERFALVITRQSRSSPRSRTCRGVYGSMTPRELFSLRCMYVPRSRFSRRTIGLLKEESARSSSCETLQSRRTAAMSRHMRAKGFSSRLLRRLSLAAAVSSSARQARCMPPRPLTQRMPPLLSSARAASMPSPGRRRPSVSVKKVCGPQAGQQSGWAW